MGCSGTKSEKPTVADAQIPNEYNVDVYTDLLHNDLTQGNASHAVRVILQCSNHQKREICKHYKNLHNTDINKDFGASFPSLYATLCLYLMQDKTKSSAHYIMRCLQEPGTRDMEVIEILCSRNAQELKLLKETYRMLYNVDMEVAIKESLSEELTDILMDLINEKETSSITSDEWAKKLVDSIDYNNLFQGKHVFADAFKNCPPSQLKEVLELFLKKCQRDINVEIEKHYQDNEYMCTRLKAISSIVRNRPLYIAEKLHSLLENFKSESEQQQLYFVFLVLILNEDYLTEVKDSYRSAFFEMLSSDIRVEVTDIVLQPALRQMIDIQVTDKILQPALLKTVK